MHRKPAVKDLKNRLGHLYKTNQEYEKSVKKTIDLIKEQIQDTLNGKSAEEQEDLKEILEVVGKQRESLAQNYIYELRRIYRYLEKVPDSEVKLILILRHIHFLNWRQIADCIGGDLTAGDVKKTHERFILDNA